MLLLTTDGKNPFVNETIDALCAALALPVKRAAHPGELTQVTLDGVVVYDKTTENT